MKILKTILVLVLEISLVGAQDPNRPKETLIDAVRRENGPVARARAAPLLPKTSFEDLLRECDLIVQGTLGEPDSYLAEEGTTLYTDYVVRNAQILFNATLRTTPKPTFVAEEIKLTQLGGTITLEGHPVIVSHSALKPLPPGVEGVFLLVQREGKNFLVRNYFGAYQIQNGAVYPLAQLAGVAAQVRGKPVAEFRAEISDILRELGR
jgi:hypothetical protein